MAAEAAAFPAETAAANPRSCCGHVKNSMAAEDSHIVGFANAAAAAGAAAFTSATAASDCSPASYAAGGGTVFIIFCQIIYPDGKAVGGAGCTAIQGNAPILGEINIADIQVNLIQFFGGNQLFQLHIRRSIHCCIQRLVDLPVILVEIRSEYSIGGFPLV